MKNIRVILFLNALLIVGFLHSANNAYATNTPVSIENIADLVEDLIPSVVNISSTPKTKPMENYPSIPHFPEGAPFEDFFDDFMEAPNHDLHRAPANAMGSGFIIDAENGYIITNNHVIENAEEIRVIFQDDESVIAKLIGSDKKTDIAVLQIETDKDLTAVKLSSSDHLRVGNWIVAIGNPFGLGGTVTTGIISARKRDINSGPYDDYLQTDASINRGNSGGPMFDLSGNVIGINTAIFSPTGGSVGIGFAIPSSLAMPIIDQIIEYGHTRRGWLGVRIQTVTDEIAQSLGMEEATGALVASITKDSPAEKGGIKAGDIILKFNGKNVNKMRSLPLIVAETKIDSKVEVVYWREGKERKSSFIIGELEKAEESGQLETKSVEISKTETTIIENTGLELSALNDTLKEEYGIKSNTKGVLVIDVKPKSEAFKKGLLEGDIIIEANQKSINTPSDMQEAIKEALKAKRPSILLLIDRADNVRFIALRIAK